MLNIFDLSGFLSNRDISFGGSHILMVIVITQTQIKITGLDTFTVVDLLNIRSKEEIPEKVN